MRRQNGLKQSSSPPLSTMVCVDYLLCSQWLLQPVRLNIPHSLSRTLLPACLLATESWHRRPFSFIRKQLRAFQLSSKCVSSFSRWITLTVNRRLWWTRFTRTPWAMALGYSWRVHLPVPVIFGLAIESEEQERRGACDVGGWQPGE